MRKKRLRVCAGFLSVVLCFSTMSLPASEVQGEETGYEGDLLTITNVNNKIADDSSWQMQSTGFDSAKESKDAALYIDETENVRQCGTFSLKQKRGQTSEFGKKSRSAQQDVSYKIGAIKEIVSDGLEESVTLEAAYIGTYCTIWRQPESESALTDAEAAEFGETFDQKIVEQMQYYFGEWSVVDDFGDADGKTALAFYEVGDFSWGFFSTADLVSESGNGNDMDMLHLNAEMKASQDSMHATMVHELQHLIHLGHTYDGESEAWLNETFSMGAEILLNYGTYDREDYAAGLGEFIEAAGFSYPFIFSEQFVPGSGITYAQWVLFANYLMKQTQGNASGGSKLFSSLFYSTRDEEKPGTSICTLESLEAILARIGYIGEDGTVPDMDTLLMNYNAALMLREGQGIYSLSCMADQPSVVGNAVIPEFTVSETIPKKIPGGGTAVWCEINGSVTAKNPGEDMRIAAFQTIPKVHIETERETTIIGDAVFLKLSQEAADVKIYYTMDESDPKDNENRLLYDPEVPIIADKNFTLNARAQDAKGRWSGITTKLFAVKAAEVKANPMPGRVAEGTEVTLSCETKEASIWYTTDGSVPHETNGQRYTEPIRLTQDTTIKARAFIENEQAIESGVIKSFCYVVQPAQADRYEPNNEMRTATAHSFPSRFEATLHTETDVDYYTFQLPDTKQLSLTLSSPADMAYGFVLYDGEGNELKRAENSEQASQNMRYSASGGQYIIKVFSLNGQVSEKGAYTLGLQKEMEQDATEKIDLSEMNMLTALTDRVNSPYASGSGLNAGGHFLNSMTYFANWDGPIAEADDPYPAAGEEGADTDYPFKRQSEKALYHVQNALFLPVSGEREDLIAHLKNAVYSYGGADIFLMGADCYWTPDYKNLYVNDTKYEYRLKDYDGGHTGVVVGWDDDYAAENFTGNPQLAAARGYTNVTIPKPSKPGAFIVRNSWGIDNAGEQGYFYLSYEDAFLVGNNPAVFITDEAANNYNHQYINDIRGTEETWYFTDAVELSEIFQNDQEQPELLEAVSFMFLSQDTNYEVYVTHNGERKKVAEGKKKYAGFYTERLSAPLTINPNDTFEVGVYVEAENGNPEVGTAFGEKAANKAYKTDANGREDISLQGLYPNIRAYTRNTEQDAYIKTAMDVKDEMSVSADRFSELPFNIQPLRSEGDAEVSRYGALAVSLGEQTQTEPLNVSLPERFDLRNMDVGTSLLPPIRNQGAFGSCWTFAAMGSAESNLIRNGGIAYDYPRGLRLSSGKQSLVLTKDEPEAALYLQAELTGAENPSNTHLSWTVTGDVDSVSVNQTGSLSGENTHVLTAIKPGKVTVTAVSDVDVQLTASCEVEIMETGVERITLKPDQLTMEKGETKTFTASTEPEQTVAPTIVWSSSRPEVANVDANGNVTGISGGETVITVKAGTATATAKVTVNGEKAVNPGSNNGDANAGDGKTAAKTAVKTGDEEIPMVTLALLCMAAAVLVTSGVRKFRKNK